LQYFSRQGSITASCSGVGSRLALIQTAGKDVLRDEGESYGRKLDEAGVDVVSTRYSSQIHDFGLLNGIRDVPSTQDALSQASEALRTYLNP